MTKLELDIRKAAEAKVSEILSGNLEYRVNLPVLEIVSNGEVIAEYVGGYVWNVDHECEEFGTTDHYYLPRKWAEEYCKSMAQQWAEEYPEEYSEDDHEDFEDYAALCLRSGISMISINAISEYMKNCKVYIETGEDLDPYN